MPVNPFDLSFGLEFECYLPEGATAAQLASAVNARIGPTHSCQAQNYNHSRTSVWKIVTDGSLGDWQRGVELVSPVLRGQAGIEIAMKALRALSDFGCTVNKKCGFHVHVGAADARGPGEMDYPIAFMRNLIRLYSAFEPAIDSIMPPSRRGSANTYCRSITAVSAAALNAATSFAQLTRVAAPGSSGDGARFYKVNLVAYNRHKTVEFRQHSGTLDEAKARYWIIMCLRMVAAARNGASIIPGSSTAAVPGASTQGGQVNRARQGTASWTIGEMMLRPEGVTGPEARAAVGWPSVSMPQQAAICGLSYTVQRTGRTVRYFARTAQAEIAATAPPPNSTPTPITLIGLLDLIGSAPDERQFMLQRQADLGSPNIQWAA